MSRNDGYLYSGSSGRSIAEQRKQRQQDKQRERSDLAPIAEKLLEDVIAERENIGAVLLDIVDPDTPDDQVASKLQAVRLYRDFLLRFESRVRATLRVSPLEAKQQKRGEAEHEA